MKKLILMAFFANVTFFRLEIGVAQAQYIDIIAPGSAAGVEGNSFLIPLDSGTFPSRFQQVYDSSIFAGFSQGSSIEAIGFRVDANMGRSFGATVTNIELHLSTTSKKPDGLSTIFDQNVGDSFHYQTIRFILIE